MDNLIEILKQITSDSSNKVDILAGKVTDVDEQRLTCKILPEREGFAEIIGVSLRVATPSNELGIYQIPKIGTTALFINLNSRYVALKFQEVKKIILKREDGIHLELDAEGNLIAENVKDVQVKNSGNLIAETGGDISLKAQGIVQLGPNGQFKALLGEIVKQIFDTHIHPTPTGPSGPPTTPMPDNALSNKVKLD